MRKIQILGAFIAALAFSAMAVTSASATIWKNSAGNVNQTEAANTHGSLDLHHELLNVKVTIHCPATGEALFDGTVGPSGTDLIEKALDSSGKEVNSTNKLSCKVTEATGSCSVGEAATAIPIHTPWTTKLRLEGTLTWDDFSEDGKGLPGYESECVTAKVKVSCEGNTRSHFDQNGANGALFLFLGDVKSTKCSDLGSSTILGHGEVLGFTVS
jgi:hypothetical protein